MIYPNMYEYFPNYSHDILHVNLKKSHKISKCKKRNKFTII